MMSFLQNPILKGALSGLAAAAIVDIHAFTRFKSKNEVAAYDWGTALLRWGQGLVGGALTAAGLGMI